MTPEPLPTVAQQITAALLRSRWLRVLGLIFVLLEMYNDAILPAWRGTIGLQIDIYNRTKAEAEAQAARGRMMDTLDITRPREPVPPTSRDTAAFAEPNQLPRIRHDLREVLPATISDAEVEQRAVRACITHFTSERCK